MGLETWTPGRVELLRQLWADGLAGSEIARRLQMTRGMVTGKRHSLGLPPRERSVQSIAMAANARRTAKIRGHRGKATPEEDRQKRQAVAALDRLTRRLPGSNPLPWEYRQPGQCTFPVDGYGAGTLSCCEPVEPGRAYCLGHVEILAGRCWPPVDPAQIEAADAVEQNRIGHLQTG